MNFWALVLPKAINSEQQFKDYESRVSGLSGTSNSRILANIPKPGGVVAHAYNPVTRGQRQEDYHGIEASLG